MADRDALTVILDGTHYELDVEHFMRRPVESMRQMIDQSDEVGDKTLSAQGQWKRSQDDFVLGTGQVYFDLTEESSRRRGWRTENVDVWERRELKILHDVITHQIAINFDNLQYVVAGGHLYLVEGPDIYMVKSAPDAAWGAVAVTGLTGAIQDVTSNGSKLYVVSDGDLLVVDPATNVATLLSSPGDCDSINYVNGRLLCTDGPDISELSATGVMAPVFTHPNPEWIWTTIVGAPNGIYIGGYGGDTPAGTTGEKSEMYLVTIVDATAALDAPFYVTGMPEGEVIHAGCFYGGLMIIGTSLGFRLATLAGSGFLFYGPLIEIEGGVRAFEPQGEFVWFGWHNILGRMSLSRFSAELVPAYARDLGGLENDVTGDLVRSIVTYGDRRWWVKKGLINYDGEAYEEDPDEYSTFGRYETSLITFGSVEEKRLTSLELRYKPLAPDENVSAKVNTEPAVVTGNWIDDSLDGSTRAKGAAVTPFNENGYESVRVVIDLLGNGASTPVVERWTLRGIPLPFRQEEIYMPLLLNSRVLAAGQSRTVGLNPFEEWTRLRALYLNRDPVELQIGSETLQVYLDGLFMGGEESAKVLSWTDDLTWFEGVVVVKVLTLEGTE